MTCKPYDIPKTLRWKAWLHVKGNQGTAGIDTETTERFEEKLGDNLYRLWNRLSSGSYFPPPVKAVPIPKNSGGVRILGIPTVADGIAQAAVKMWLEPRLDPIFRKDSCGYRPGKSALEAIAVTRRRYARVSTDGQIVDAQVRQLTKAGCKKVFREVASGRRPTARSFAA